MENKQKRPWDQANRQGQNQSDFNSNPPEHNSQNDSSQAMNNEDLHEDTYEASERAQRLSGQGYNSSNRNQDSSYDREEDGN